MPEIIDTLRLNIDQALRDVQRFGQALDRALTGTELKIDETSIQNVESALRDVRTIVDDTTAQVRLTADQYREVARAVALGETPARAIADATGQIRDAANLATADFREVAGALNLSEDAARRMAGEILEAKAASDRVESSARDIARQLDLSEDEARQFTSALSRADREAREVATSTGRISSGFAGLRSSALGLVAGFGAFTAIRGAVRLAGEARDAFAELQDSVNAVKVVFGEAAGPILAFSDNVAQSAGLSMAEFNQAASVLGSSLLNVGFGADEAAGKTIELTQRAADMASIFGGEVSVAVDAILSALRGESNPIERFGVTLTEAKVQAEAAALGFRTVNGEFDSGAKAAARLNIIMRETERTSGDFANTADDLANAQKVANAEFTNAKAALGEALLPIFQSLLNAAPEVLEAIEDLAPALQDLALGAADLATSTPGVFDFVDVLRTLVDLPRGFGQIFEGISGQIAAAGDQLGILDRLVAGDLVGAFDALGDASENAEDRIQGTLERINTQGLIDDLREGEDAALALANRLADVGSRGKLDREFILGLQQIAGTDLAQTSAAIKTLIADASRLGLEKDEISALRRVWNELNEEILVSPRRIDPTITALEELAETAAPSALDAVTIAATEAGLSISEFVLSADPIAQAMVDALDPADRLDLILDAIGEDAAAAATAFRASLTPALIDANEALVDFNDNGVVTLDEFIRASEEAALAVLAFKANIAIIAETSPEVAASLLALGAEQGALIAQGFVDNPIRILEQEGILLGTSTGLAERINDLVSQAMRIFSSQGPDAVADFSEFIAELFPDDPALVKQITDRIDAMLLEGIDPDRIRAAFSQPEAATAGAVVTVNAYVAGLEQNLAADVIGIGAPVFEAFGIDLTIQGEATTASYLAGLTDDLTANVTALAGPIFNLFDIDLAALGADARSTYFDGLTTPSESETSRLRGSIVNTFQSAIEEHSPSKLFLDFGERSGDAFWSGFNQSELTLRTPAPPTTGSIAGSTVAGQTVGGVNVEVNINNPTVNDAVSDTARVAQFASSIAASYRSVT